MSAPKQFTLEQLHHVATELEARRDVAKAKQVLELILASYPDDLNALHRMGAMLLYEGESSQALSFTARALQIRPDALPVMNNHAIALFDTKQYVAAEEVFRLILDREPENWSARYNYGRLLYAVKRFDEALLEFQQALQIEPDNAETLNNLGLAEFALHQYAEASAYFQRACERRPDYFEALTNHAMTLEQLGLADEARALLEAVIEVRPQDAAAHYNLAMLLFHQGELALAFEEYEWRWKSPQSTSIPRSFSQPQWEGQPLQGARLLVHAEQGLGDTLQFIRYLPKIVEKAGSVIVEVQAPLVKLLAGSFPELGCEWVAQGTALPEFDLHIPLLSVPRVFGTTMETIADVAAVPYLRLNPLSTIGWSEKLTSRAEILRVGLVWSGNPNHPNDHNRSMSWQEMQPIVDAAAHSVQFYALSPGRRPGDERVIDLGPQLHDFAETAAAIANLDLIIAVDTSIVHAAGALGKPVWMLLSSVSDWRWVSGEDTSPWYPSLRIVRQSQPGDWSEPVAAIARALRDHTDL